MTGQTHRQRWRDAIRDSTDPRLDPIALAVAMALDRHMDAAGRTHTGQHKLARYAKVRSTSTIVDRIAVLEATGWLAVDRPTKNGGRTRYEATIPEAECPTRPDTSDRPTACDGPANPQPSHETNPQPSHAVDATITRGVTDPVDPESSSRAANVDRPPTSERRPAEEEDLAQTIENPAAWTNGPPPELWELMARRRLGIELDAGRRIRQKPGWLRATAESYRADLEHQALAELADLPPGAEADLLVWRLDPDLARHNWMFATPEETERQMAQHRAEIAEEKRRRNDPAEQAAIKATIAKAKAGLRQQRRKRTQPIADPAVEAERLEAHANELYDRAEQHRAAGDHAFADTCTTAAERMLARADELDPSPPAVVAHRTTTGLVIRHLEATA